MNSKRRDDIEAIYPLSPMQQGMLFHALSAPEWGLYFQQLGCRLRGALDVPAFQAAWEQVVARHPILRTLFVWERRSEPLQVVRRTVKIPWQIHDWQGLPRSEQEARLAAFLDADRRQGLDLSKAPLLRFTLFQLSPNEYQFFWTTHHLLNDGWSHPILLEEVLTLYEARRRGQTVTLPTRRPYRDYISWLQQQDMASAERFWRERLAGVSSPTPLVIDRPASQDQSSISDSQQHILLSEQVTSGLRALARQHHLTRNTIIQGVWALLLSRYSGLRDVIFGSVVSGRPPSLPGAEGMVGLFVNTLPVRVTVSPDAELLPWLHAIQAQQGEMQQYEYTPAVKVQGWSEMPRGTHLFETLLAFNNYWSGSTVDESEAGLEIIPDSPSQTTNYPLALSITPMAELVVEVHYDSRRFDAAAISRLLGHVRALLESIVAKPEQRLRDLSLLTREEAQQILVDWNQSAAPFPHERCIHELIEAQAAQRPEAIAAEWEGQRLSYRELDEQANQLAHHLRARGIGPEKLVGICVTRSLEMLVGILGTLKAGGAYLPLDPAYPSERLAYMIQDSGIPVLLSQEALVPTLPAHETTVICLDRDGATIAREPRSKPDSGVTPDNLAYVIYTSGSTGRPKGVMVGHRGLVNLSEAQRRTFALEAENQVLQFSSLSFDASVFETVMALCQGSTLHLSTAERLRPGPDLLALLRERAISNITFPPSALATLPQDDLPALHTIVVAGEACPPDLVARWAEGRRFFNAYGPTESTIWATVAPCTDGTSKPSIGQPIANTQIYLLDSALRPVPVGVPGEMYIGGVGLARGYLNRPALTAERFVPNPFSREPGARLYRTGDLARYLPDGDLDFLGRIDHQVKVRGFRIELGEIEAVLGQHPAVREAAVLARPRSAGDHELVAYLVPHQAAPAAPELRAFLKERLPDHMIPVRYHTLNAFPLTPNGKVDRKALPALETARAADGGDYVAPRTPAEATLAEMWATVLGVERVGVHDNFFELGGHSLLVTALVFRIREAFGVELPLNRLFVAPTVAGLAETLTRLQGGDHATLTIPDLRAEALLDPAIPQVTTPLAPMPPARVLLTGGTGFLGAFLLAELLAQTKATVVALVRAKNPDEGMARLQRSLEQYGLWQEAWRERIVPLPGDLALPRLGLSEEAFSHLASELDSIYHNGALVNFIQPYSTLKAANVLGTQEVLRLAGMYTLKPVHYVSTLSVFSPEAYHEQPTLYEETPLDRYEGLEGGYTQSKWVAEQLLTLARERGMPISIHRPGRITGDSRTGAGSTDDFFYRMLKGCIQLGSIPTVEMAVDMIPVEYVARAIVHIAEQPDATGRNFHYVNPSPIPLSHLIAWIRSFGYPIEQLPYPQWRERLMQDSQASDQNALYPLLATFGPAVAASQEGDTGAAPQHHLDCRNTLAGLAGSGMSCPPVDDALLTTYFTAFIRSGFLHEPPVEQRMEHSP